MLVTKQIRLHDWQMKWLAKKASQNNLKISSLIRFSVSSLLARIKYDTKLDSKILEDTDFKARNSSKA